MLTMIKDQIKNAMREKDEIKKTILRFLVSEVEAAQLKINKIFDENQIASICRKLIQKNEESLSYLKEDDSRVEVLKKENLILTSLLPRTLSLDDIITNLNEISDDIKNNDIGKAIGLSIKFLKSKNLNALGNDVKAAVSSIKGV